MKDFHYISYAQEVIFGHAALTRMAEALKHSGWQRLMLCTSRSMRRNGHAGTFNPSRRWLFVDQISVEPEWEGRGIGRELIRAVVDYARAAQIDDLETETWAFNMAAQEFFTAVGFQPKTERFWMHLD